MIRSVTLNTNSKHQYFDKSTKTTISYFDLPKKDSKSSMLFIPLEETEDIGEFLPAERFGEEELCSAGAL